ncbi:TrkA C-terminal domain-containing protein [Agromyces sp. MMS24-JH15]|uniref:TrkA C-terminal domain-containing protein n=1 Tax=Agromyces sp. MMS24-JH15 TaxID=3243765 RepID=UPI003748346B
MVEVRRVTLPGVGMLHSFTTADDVEIAVVAHRSGSSDLVVRPGGAQGSARPVRLDEEEASTLADLLGGTTIVETIADLDEVPGVPIDWFTVRADDALAGRSLGDLPGVARPDVVVAAVVRRDRATPSPDAAFVVEAGDTLILVGPGDAVDEVVQAARGASA